MNRSIFANLVDVFHLTLDEIGDLTDWQILQIYFHPRKKTGEIDTEKAQEKIAKRKERLNRIKDIGTEVPVSNDRYNEYFESYQVVFNLFQSKLLSKEDYSRLIGELQVKFADVFDKRLSSHDKDNDKHEDYETSYQKLHSYHVAGMISKEQFDEAIKRLKQMNK